MHAVARIADRRGLCGRGEPRPVDGLRRRDLPRLRRAGAGRRRAAAEVPLRLHRGARVRRRARRVARRRELARTARRRRAGRAGGGARVKLAVELAGLRFKNPLIAASGTFGYGVEYEGILDLSRLGGIVSKGLYMEPRDGAPVPRIVETPSGPAERDRPAGRRRARLRARRAAAHGPPRHGAARQRVRRHRRRVRRGGARVRRRARHPRARGQHLLPERQEGRDGLRRRPAHDARGGGGGAQGDPAADRSRSCRRTSATSRSSRARPRRPAPTRSPASTRCWASRSTSRRAGRGSASAPAGSRGPRSARWRCGWPGRPRARCASR